MRKVIELLSFFYYRIIRKRRRGMKQKSNVFLAEEKISVLMRKFAVPCIISLLAAAVMIGDGCCAFVSISLGAGKKEEAHRRGALVVPLSCVFSSVS